MTRKEIAKLPKEEIEYQKLLKSSKTFMGSFYQLGQAVNNCKKEIIKAIPILRKYYEQKRD